MGKPEETEDRCSTFQMESTDTLDDHCYSYSPSKANAELADMIGKMGLPKSVVPWGGCTECKHPLDLTAVKAFGLRLNAKAIGNFFVEVLCPKCSSAYELHYEQVCEDFVGFQKFLMEGPGDMKPVASHKIPFWKNNLLEKVVKEQGKEKAMALIKRGECKGSVVVSETLYSCPGCGHVEVSSAVGSEGMKCPKCGMDMEFHSHSEGQDDQQAD